MLTDTQMLQAIHFRSSVALQVTLDQDYNVPDNKSDIEKVIVENGEIQIQNIKTMPDKMILKGSLFWRMAYLKIARIVHWIIWKVNCLLKKLSIWTV